MARRKKSDAQKIDELVNGRGTAAEMAAAIIQEFGGLKSFALAFNQEFHAAKAGSVARQRLILGVINLNTQADRIETPAALEDFDDEDLQALSDQLNAKAQQATETAAPAPSKPAADRGQKKADSAGATEDSREPTA